MPELGLIRMAWDTHVRQRLDVLDMCKIKNYISNVNKTVMGQCFNLMTNNLLATVLLQNV